MPVGEARRHARARSGSRSRLAQPLGERHQRAREVAAVDGRHVARRERRQALRVVPVEQVALEALQALHGRERSVDPLRESLGREKPRSCAASVASSPMPMLVGEVRCASCGSGTSWKLSGGRRVVLGTHEVLEVAPGVSRDLLRKARSAGAELRRRRLGTGRLRTWATNGAAAQSSEHRRGHRERGRPRARHEHEAERGDERARDHLRDERPRAAAAARRARRWPRPSPIRAARAWWPRAGPA